MELSNGEQDKQIERELERTNAYVLSLLKDKRRLLTELENERKVSRKLKSDCRELRKWIKEVETGPEEQAAPSNLNSLASTSEDKKAEELLEKVDALEKHLRESRAQISCLEDHKAVLEAEILRLAESLGKEDASSEVDLAIEQLSIYEDDFKKERNDKEKAETQVSALTDQVLGCQDIISQLTREVDLYKNAFEREKRDKELALMRERDESGLQLHNLPPHSQSELPNFPGTQARLMPAPHLQIVYPIVDEREQQRDMKRKQEMYRRGVLARDSPETTDFFCDAHFDVNTL